MIKEIIKDENILKKVTVEDIKKKEYLQTLICENMFQMYIVIQNYKHEYKVYTGV